MISRSSGTRLKGGYSLPIPVMERLRSPKVFLVATCGMLVTAIMMSSIEGFEASESEIQRC